MHFHISSARRVNERFSGWTAQVDRVWWCTLGIPSNAQMKELATDSDFKEFDIQRVPHDD